jgi:hypothetical protein
MAMHTNITSQVDATAWDRQAQSLSAPFFHSTAWAHYSMAGHPNLESAYYTLEDGREVLGVALLFHHASRNPLLRPFTRNIYSDAHPAVRDADPALLRLFLEGIERETRNAGGVRLTIGSFATPGHRDTLENLGYRLEDRYEFALSLEKTEDELWAAMEYRRRRSVRKAEKLSVDIEPLTLEEGIPELRRLLAATGTRLQKRGAQVHFGGDRLGSSISMLVQSRKASIIGARYHGVVVSAILIIETGDMAYYSLAGHSPESFAVHAPTLLLWRTILRYKTSGVKWFNFGGVSFSAADPKDLEYGLYCFKKGFGGAPELCTTGTKVLRPVQQEVIARLQAIRAHAKR